MQSHLAGNAPPYRLPSNVIYFHDWRYVQHGNPMSFWRSESGEPVPLFNPEPPPKMRYEYGWSNTPGLKLRTIPACKSEPVITPENSPMPLIFWAANLMYDEGRYRAWLEFAPPENYARPGGGEHNLIRYGESDDGMTWRFPELGLVEYRGNRRNNVVYGAPLTPDTGLNGMGVFKDPSGPPAERYKMLHMGRLRGARLDDYLAKRPEDVEPGKLYRDVAAGEFKGGPAPGARPEALCAIFGAVSPDGLKWTKLPEPLVAQTSDTQNTCSYDPARKTYVGYVRMYMMQRRTIGRIESADFRRFPRPEVVFWPGPERPHTEFWYANAKTVMPGAPEYHVMFPLRWDIARDCHDAFLATSPDNVTWNFIPGGPVCAPGERGAWDCGGVWLGHELVNLPDGRMGLLYVGVPIPHKYPRHVPMGANAWAWWEKDRLVALECADEGRFSTAPVLFDGRTVRLNYRAFGSGSIRVGAFAHDGRAAQPLPGRSLEDCDYITGNELDRVVTWKGQSDLGHAPGTAVFLRVQMRHAELFSIRFTN